MSHPACTVLRLRDLRFACVIGVHDWEQSTRQLTVHLDIELRVEAARRAAASDRLADTLDYAELENRIASLLQSRSFQLLETMADAIACAVLSETCVRHVRVEIEKPGALRFAPMVAMVHEASNS